MAHLSCAQLAAAWGVSSRTVRRHCQTGKLPAQQAAGCRGGRAGVVYLISASSPQLVSPIRPADYAGASEHAAPTIDLSSILAAGGQAAIRSAHVRAQVARKATSVQGRGVTAKRQAIADEAGISLVTLYRWMNRLQRGGTLGLVQKTESDPLAPSAGARSFDVQAINYGLGEYAQLGRAGLRPKISHIWDRLRLAAKEHGWRLGSRATFYRIINDRLTRSEKAFLIEGETNWKKDFMPKARRDYSEMLPNEWWVGDHHQFALFITNGGRAIRPWLTAWMDMRSRQLVGWAIGVTPNSETIALALRHGIVSSGLPANAYIDNGKDYRSKRLHGGREVRGRDYSREMAGIFTALGIGTTAAIPYQPWAKPIERCFETFTDRFTRYQPGWCGEKPEERPEGFDPESLRKAGKLLTLEQLAEHFAQWLETEYHARPHSGDGMNGETPAAVWDRLPKARQDSVTERQLDVLLMKAEKVHIYGDVIKRFDHEYQHDDLARFAGMNITVRYDPNRIGKLHCFYKDRYICTATNRRLLTMGAEEADIREHISRQRRERRRIVEKIQTFGEQVAASKVRGKRTVAGPAPEDGKKPPKVVALTGLEGVPADAAGDSDGGALLPRRSGLGDRLLREQGLKVLGQGQQ